jgi:aryl-alcohol dehydrogenase-like predicted oxidoreductase
VSIDRIVLGSADLGPDTASAVLDRFRDRGGRTLDLANVYGDGESSRAVGDWLRAAGARDAFVLIAKGCHPPFCSPSLVGPEVDRARSLLGIDSLDAFVLHRDDPAVDVGEWAAALSSEVDRGSIARFGVSNWTVARFGELRSALGPAADGLGVFSNHFSLAEMVTPTWPGCLAMDREEAAEVASTGTTVLAWAALAGGYFAGREAASWDSPANAGRRERARDLARSVGVETPAIALAFVLDQPVPVSAVVGTRSAAHLEELLAAADVRLSDDQLSWLEHG